MYTTLLLAQMSITTTHLTMFGANNCTISQMSITTTHLTKFGASN